MRPEWIKSSFGLDGKVAIVTGGTGVLGAAMAGGLAQAGARVGLLGRRRHRAEEVAQSIEQAGGQALALPADVLRKDQLEAARDTALERWGRIDILVNAAGGQVPEAVQPEGGEFFDVPAEALRQVIELNLLGTILPSQVFAAAMVRQTPKPSGCIVNISSMNAQRPLTRVAGYAAAKAGVDNFTRWLAAELARRYGAGLRVNAIAPGFFLAEHNRDLLINPDGSLTGRGQAIIDHTPAGRFGEPDELLGTLIWLCSTGAAFVNGIVVPVDGGFSAFSGV
jgi:NAD(P)-dependent dehydrogenase (short-subunit alcohol dehydrogenase family)